MQTRSWHRVFAAAVLPAVLAVIPMNASTVVAFGDSTTATRDGIRTYSEILADEFAINGRPVHVLNAGVPGNTTRDARERFIPDVLERNPDIVIVQFGLNDAAVDVWKNPPAKGSRVPIDEYQENLRHFIQRCRAAGCRVVMMTPNRMHWTPQLVELYGKPPYDPTSPDGLNLLLRPYVDAMIEVAGALSVELIDVHQTMNALPDEESAALLLDGMHPNNAGHRNAADLLLAHFRRQPTAANPRPQTSNAPH